MAKKLPPLPPGVPPGGFQWNDWYEKLRQQLNEFIGGIGWSSITGTPTTLSGYGITDAQKAIQFQDEGSNTGSLGLVDVINFTGSGVTASASGNTLTVNVSGGGGGGGGGTSFETTAAMVSLRV